MQNNMTCADFVNKNDVFFYNCLDFYTREEVVKFASEKLLEGDIAIHGLLEDLIEYPYTEYWKFDASMYGYGATPLTSVEEMKDYLREVYGEDVKFVEW